ncbi:MAG: trehalose-6-phosphate synthase, partial [Nodosilinea sp.]
YKGRTVNVDAFPVGTNPSYIHETVNSPAVLERVDAIRSDIGDNKLIVSAGRVDYVKGAKEMLLCYERLLERRPELRGKVNLIMTAVKAAAGMRVYKTAQSEIEQLAGQINGKYSTLTWNAIQLFTEPIPFNDLMALYKTADIAWIPPLRDGLNLVAKEYIAAHGGEHGVLVLSEFTGSAVELPDAILTNPYSDKNMDECIDLALDMPFDEQKRRMTNMHSAITQYDVQQWANHMFREANAVSVTDEPEKDLVLA